MGGHVEMVDMNGEASLDVARGRDNLSEGDELVHQEPQSNLVVDEDSGPGNLGQEANAAVLHRPRSPSDGEIGPENLQQEGHLASLGMATADGSLILALLTSGAGESPVLVDTVEQTDAAYGHCSDDGGNGAGGLKPSGTSMEDVISFEGIPDPSSGERRFNHRLQGQPDADDIQLGRAMRAAKLRDIEVSTSMPDNTNCSILHFSEHKIVDKASNLGISLRSNEKEIAKSVT